MKLVSFRLKGHASYGVVENDVVADVGQVLKSKFPDLRSLLGSLPEAKQAMSGAPKVPLSQIELLPPISNPEKIFCIGHNYEEHRVETGRPKTAHPSVFLRFADTQVAHGGEAWIPDSSREIDYEGELAVVIGRGGRRISRSEALSHVAGYSCYNDISVRDWQRHTTQFTPGKNFPGTGGFGPWLVTADEIPDPQKLSLVTRLNGQEVQRANTDQMIFQVADLIEYLSGFTPLGTGDVIVSGTPGGVGVKRDPQLFMKSGDKVEVEIGSIGTLSLRMVPEPR